MSVWGCSGTRHHGGLGGAGGEGGGGLGGGLGGGAGGLGGGLGGGGGEGGAGGGHGGRGGGGGGLGVGATAWAMRLGLLLPGFDSMSVPPEAMDVTSACTFAGGMLPWSESTCAAIPATYGQAMDVPESVRVPLASTCDAEVIVSPGAYTSTQPSP